MAKLSPVFNDQTIDANGDPYVGAQLFTYAAGSSTKQAVYTDAAGTIPHSNPIEIDSLGFPEKGTIWIPEGISIKFVLAPPTDTDPPTSPIKTIDNVQGVNDASVSISEWQASGVVPNYISATSFSVEGDQTTEFQKGRRAQFTTGLGTVYGKIINSVFAASITTVTMLMDGTDVLDSGLSVVNLSLLRATPSSLPNPIELLRSAVVGHATLTPTWDYAYGEVQDVSGVITYTAIPNAPRAGSYRIWYPAAGSVMTHGGNISVQGSEDAIAAAGDKWIINAVTTTTFDVEIVKKSGNSQWLVRNRLRNGDFRVNQTGLTYTSASLRPNNDDAYTLDGWYILSDGSDVVDVSQESVTVPANGLNAISLDVETVNKKFGIAQIIEARDCVDLIGNTVTLSFKAKVSSTAKLDNVKCAIVAWSGASDAVTSDIVSAWDVEGTNPTLIANATYENAPTNLNLTTDYATYSVSAPVDTASAKNIIVFIWSDVTDTNLGEFVYVTDIQLEVGSAASSYERKPIDTELSIAERHLPVWKSSSTNDMVCSAHSSSATIARGVYPFKRKTRMPISGIVSSAASGFSYFNSGANVGSALAFSIGGDSASSVSLTCASLSANLGGYIYCTDASGLIIFTGAEL